MDSTIRVPAALMQPIVSDEVAARLTEVIVTAPVNGMIEIAGPEPIRQDELIRQYLRATGDSRTVTVDAAARYFGIALNDQSLTPGPQVRLGKVRFQDWLKRAAKAA